MYNLNVEKVSEIQREKLTTTRTNENSLIHSFILSFFHNIYTYIC